MKTIGAVIGRISSPLSIGRVPAPRPAGTGAGRTSPPSRRRPGRRRRRWRRSRARCGRARSRRSARAPGARPARRRASAARPATATTAVVAPLQALRLDQRQDDRGEPDSQRQQAGAVDRAVPAPGSVDSGAATAVIADPDRGHRQVDPEDHPPVDFDQHPAGQRPDRQRQRRDRRPDPKRPRLLGGRKGIADDRQRERATSAPRRLPAGCGRRSAPPGSQPPPETTEPARRPPCRRGRRRLRPNMSPSRPAVTTKHRDRQQVAVHHPLQPAALAPTSAADARQCQRHHGRVEHQQKEPGAGPRKRPPRSIVLVDPQHVGQTTKRLGRDRGRCPSDCRPRRAHS